MNKPNIIFIHCDQLHHKAISAYGCKHVKTPNIDRIVREGYSFMESYASMPQCCPSRASWYTGRMSKEHGVVVNGYPIDPKLPDLGQWLRKHGYETVFTGKWHVSGRNVADSFDVLHPGHGLGELGDSDVARSAVAYLNNRTGKKPFFLPIGFLNPHDCCFPAVATGGPAKYAFASKIKDKLPPLPANFDHNYQNDRTNRRSRTWSKQDWRYYIYHYYRLTEMADAEIGRVCDALRSSPYAEDTLLIFVADHGDGLGFHANVSKGYLEEEASRVPAVVWWPGHVKSNHKDTDHLVSGVDVAATICDYAAAPPLPKMSIARSWRPLLEGRSIPWRDHVVCETSIGSLSTCIRDKQYKSIIYTDRTKLYDIANDPLETKDLAPDPKYAPVLERHRRQFREYIAKIEVYPGPPDFAQQLARDQQAARKNKNRRRKFPAGDLYKAYTDWYRTIAAEG